MSTSTQAQGRGRTGRPAARFATADRLRALQGPRGPEAPERRALAIAREAAAQVAGTPPRAAPSAQVPAERKADCGEAFWSWAMPEGWRR